MSKEHTPTPWCTEQNEYSTIIVKDGVSIGSMFDREVCGNKELPNEANAAHIVKCVNMHDELVEALKKIYGNGDATGCNPQLMANISYETLKKAGEL
jgi:hypothetical protein